jgi:hypothetical protein
MPEYLPLPEAAARLGGSISTLRRRRHPGAARGERRPTPAGFAGYLEVDDDAPAAPPKATVTPTDTPPQGPTDSATPTPPQGPTDSATPTPPQAPVLATRAQEMAAYTEQPLRPYVAEIGELRQRMGRREAELEHARAQPPNGAASGWPERRRWGQRVRWG